MLGERDAETPSASDPTPRGSAHSASSCWAQRPHLDCPGRDPRSLGGLRRLRLHGLPL